MKLRGGLSQASALPGLLSMLFALVHATFFGAAAAAGAVALDNKAAETSITQIRDTLHNLLRSIDDAGRDAESLFGKRQFWCDQVVSDFESSEHLGDVALSALKASLIEDEAAVEEAQGTVRQVKVDIEMVKHTIKQTQDMMEVAVSGGSSLIQGEHQAESGVLTALMENKRLSLDSLQGELEVAVPVLAQLEAGVAETKQRVSYRSDSLDAGRDFLASLKDTCSAGAERADSQAAARIGESNSISVALQALEAIATQLTAAKEQAPLPSMSSAIAAADALDSSSDSQEVSFVQVSSSSKAEVTTDELEALFDEAPSSSAPEPRSVQENRPQQVVQPMSIAASMRPRVQSMLAQIRQSAPESPQQQAQWCAKQKEDSALALKLAKDSVAQLDSQLDAHSDAEAELNEDLQKQQATSKSIAQVVSRVSDESAKEQALIKTTRKDQELATKILDQATTILKDIGVANVTQAVNGLISAKNTLLAQIAAADGFQKEASEKATSLAQLSQQFSHTQESEQHTLELARDDHSTERLKGVESKRLYEADVEEATQYLQKLAEGCKSAAEEQAAAQRSTQIHALEDADKALQGKLVQQKEASQSNLRGVDKAPINKNLTPMQRAAAEMGVALD